MKHLTLLACLALPLAGLGLSAAALTTISPATGAAQSRAPKALPQGLRSARLLPGWTDAQGQRISALELVLAPGWKTYWRSPGDAGLPPQFDWRGENIGAVTLHWPAPQIVISDGVRTLGYHDRLVLPFSVTPAQQGQPVELAAHLELGLCKSVCVPASLDLAAPVAGDTPDPAILAAMKLVPQQGAHLPACEIAEIEDGMKVTLSLPEAGADLAIEHAADESIWVSAPQLSADGTEASADFVAPSGKPFPLDPDAVVMTLIGAQGAVEYQGCAAG